MRQKARPRLGILGGLGPLASVDFFAKLTGLTDAAHDAEHLPLVLVSMPAIPDRSSAVLGRGPSPLMAMQDGVRLLDELGVECIVITCNTAYHWYDDLAHVSKARLLHIVDGVVRALKARAPSGARVSVLGTRGTLASGYYQRRLAHAGFVPAAPSISDRQGDIDLVIAAVKGGQIGQAAACFEGIMNALVNENTEAAVLACTELPIANAARKVSKDMIVVDATLELAREALRFLDYPIRQELQLRSGS